MIAAVVSICIVLAAVAIAVARKTPRKLNPDYFGEAWKEIQNRCKDKGSWSDAIVEADKLLDRALKRRKFKGRSMGERMVSAQRKFTNNDGLWFAHNLYKKILVDPDLKLREADVKEALVGYRQALRDLGALQSVESRSS
ncbi:MAG: hypothetical protein JWL85_395 [Candidatus Saccharibacteria bacterium]|nr:hypothetical protein [Candidatus Saccharibacteria bacterium]